MINTTTILETYLGGIASLVTITIALLVSWKYGYANWEKYFLAKSAEQTVRAPFTYRDVRAGIGRLLAYAEKTNAEAIVGINRGGSIIGGMLGKQLGLMVYLIEVKTFDDEPPATLYCPNEILEGKRVLLVDDRLHDGRSIDKAYHHLSQLTPDVRIAVFALVDRKGQCRQPDMQAYVVADRNIPLPWEPGRPAEWSDLRAKRNSQGKTR